MSSIKKIEKARELINKNHKIFKCPVCGGSMYLKRENSLACGSGHSFDLSKKGYLNLLTSGRAPVYSKDLFESRRKVCEAGFYDPLIEALTEIIAKYSGSSPKTGIAVLDAGCGEGSHLTGISQRMNELHPGRAEQNTVAGKNVFTGIDISKDSIQIAARGEPDIIWCVSDLSSLPFRDGSFDVVLNILSPANYGEFKRILSRRGMLVKVVPGERYLAEIREAVGGGEKAGGSKTESYSNERVVQYFEERMEVVDILDIGYQFHVEEQLLPHLIRMTPLTWGKDADGLLSSRGMSEITVDLTVLTGQNK
ncbi:MAG TPA: methyltransferase domain-containing protein [Anaerovoracaceae bacterium]|nr:methyltransferase domain-containing protein [Anaerovoracaceae bacterium]